MSQALTTYHLRRALVRCPWRLWAQAEGGQAQSTVIVGAHDVRQEWRELVRSIDTTSQDRRLPGDVTAWITHRVKVGDVTLWLRPIADHDGWTPRSWQTRVIRKHITDAARTTLQPRRSAARA